MRWPASIYLTLPMTAPPTANCISDTTLRFANFLKDLASTIYFWSTAKVETSFILSTKSSIMQHRYWMAYANSGIGEAFRAVYKKTNADAVVLTDFSSYKPSYEAPAAFIASPIIKNDKNIGVLIFQMPIERINNVMTSHENWAAVGLGQSGETYSVGEDLTMRSQSRFLIEDKVSYLQALRISGTDQSVLDKIKSKNTSITLQTDDSESARRAIAGESGSHIIND